MKDLLLRFWASCTPAVRIVLVLGSLSLVASAIRPKPPEPAPVAVDPVQANCVETRVFTGVTIYSDGKCQVPIGVIAGGRASDSEAVFVDYPGPGKAGNVRRERPYKSLGVTYCRLDDPAVGRQKWKLIAE